MSNSVLLVVATFEEIESLNLVLDKIPNQGELVSINGFSFDFQLLVTGVGPIMAGIYLTRTLSKHSFDLVINFGLCGVFDSKWEIGDCVVVVSDVFADVGADDNGTFIDLFDLELMANEDSSFSANRLTPISIDGLNLLASLPKAHAITVSVASGSTSIINQRLKKYSPDVESMEGAAIVYASNLFCIPSIQLRAISNHVEPRNKENWNIPLALLNGSKHLNELLSHVENMLV